MAAFQIIQTGGGLVQNNDLRLYRQHGSQRHQLPLPPGEGEGLLLPGEAESLQHLIGPGFDAVFIQILPDGPEPEGDFLPHGVPADLLVRILEQEAHPAGSLADAADRRILSVDEHAPGGRLQEPVDQLDGGGFSGAVRAEDGDKLAGLNRKGEILHRGAGAVGETCLFQLNHADTP